MSPADKGQRSVALICSIFVCFLITLNNAQIWKDSPHLLHREHNLQRSQHLMKSYEARSDEDLYRLPTALKPSHQVVKLNPTMGGDFSIAGYTEILFTVLEETNVVQLNMIDIITNNGTIKLVDLDDIAVSLEFTSHEFNLTKQAYIGTLTQPLIVGHSYNISMEFEGLLNGGLSGFYRSTYQNDKGEEVLLATTQMEPIAARQVFPCFDEPAMKATFGIEIARDPSLHAIANMPLSETYIDSSGVTWDIFDTTPIMSTYLIAFTISDFVQVNRTTNDGTVLFRVWCRQNAIQYADYAIQNGPDILSFYEDYYGIKFPLPKQDMAAIPDFLFGAMENWGLITYREVALLYSPTESSASYKRYVDIVMAHELVHQWFGDLVTMKWWTDIWLNEGFAEYMENYGVDEVSPDYDIFNTFTIDEMHYAFSIDDTDSSHPLSVEVNDPTEINAIFDGITYSKGSSVVRSMRYMLTEETFHQALTNYLTDHQYGNTEQDDLWAAMTNQSHADGTLDSSMTVKEIMDTWTLQMGYPVIDVNINADGSAVLTQERYYERVDPNSTDTHDYEWWVPISWTAQDDPTFGDVTVYDWLTPTDSSKVITGLPSNSNWMIFNVDQGFYYRVNYDVNNWQLLTDQLNTDHLSFSILTRAQLIDDAMNFAVTIPGRLEYPIALGVNAYLSSEVDYVPWVAALENFEYLEEMFTNTTGYANLKDYLLDLLIPFYDSVGFDDSLTDPHLDQMSRSLAVSWTCHLNYTDCVTRADSLYAEWVATPAINPISPNVKYSIYCTAIADGDQAEFDFAYGKYLTTDLASEKDNFLYSMGCSRQEDILSSYLDMVYKDSNSTIKSQDVYKVWYAVSDNDYGNAVAWDYLNTNWDQMATYYGSYNPLAGLASIVTIEWNTPEELATLQDFRTERADDLGSSVETVDNAIDGVERNIAWMESYYDIILQWLKDQGH